MRRTYLPLMRVLARSDHGGAATSSRSWSSRRAYRSLVSTSPRAVRARSCSSTSGDHSSERTRSGSQSTSARSSTRASMEESSRSRRTSESRTSPSASASQASSSRSGSVTARSRKGRPVASIDRRRRIATRIVCTPSGRPSRTRGSRARTSRTRSPRRCWISCWVRSRGRDGACGRSGLLAEGVGEPRPAVGRSCARVGERACRDGGGASGGPRRASPRPRARR